MGSKVELLCLLEKLFPNINSKNIKWEASVMEFCKSKILETLKTQIQKVVDAGYTDQEARVAIVKYLQKVSGMKAFPDVADAVAENLRLQKEKGGKDEEEEIVTDDDLSNVAEQLLTTYIQVFRCAQPNAITEEALWRLVLSDMDLKEACLKECNCWKNENQSGNNKCQSAHTCAAEFGCKNGLVIQKCKKSMVKPQPQPLSTAAAGAAPAAELPKSGSSKKAKRRAKQVNKKKAAQMTTATGGGEADLTPRSASVGGSACTGSVDESVNSVDEDNVPEKTSDFPIIIARGHEISQPLEQESNDGNPNPSPCPSRIGKPKNDLTPEEKDKLLAFLQKRASELQAEIPYWTNWANKKVSDVAVQLNQNKNDLQKLRRERDTPQNRAELKRILEEQTEKRISEIGEALRKTIEEANKIDETAQLLEKENAVLKQQMLAAKREAEEAAARRELALKSEQNTMRKVEETEEERRLMEEELRELKKTHERILVACFMKGKERDDMLREKERVQKEKEFLLEQAAAIRKQKEKNNVAAIVKEGKMKRNAQRGLKEYKDKIEKTKEAIAKKEQLNFQAKLVALHHKERVKSGESTSSSSSKKADPAEERRRNRECVMCLSAETKVLFRPCCHKILCIACNEMHEKQSMKECPTCRTPIQQRIPVKNVNC